MNPNTVNHIHDARSHYAARQARQMGRVSAWTWSTHAVDAQQFVNAMRGAATGVNIVSTDGPAGRFGLTVSAFSSVSAEPPMVLVCINRKSPACNAVCENRRFCVNVLSTKQRLLADTFAGMPQDSEAYDFANAAWVTGATGAPMLADSVAGFDCVLTTAIEAGTPTIYIGEVHEVAGTEAKPLI